MRCAIFAFVLSIPSSETSSRKLWVHALSSMVLNAKGHALLSDLMKSKQMKKNVRNVALSSEARREMEAIGGHVKEHTEVNEFAFV